MSKEVAIITDHGEKVCYEELLKYTKEFQEIICRDRSLVIIMAANTIGSVA